MNDKSSSVKIIDTQTATNLAYLKINTTPITTIAISRDGTIFTGNEEGIITGWPIK